MKKRILSSLLSLVMLLSLLPPALAAEESILTDENYLSIKTPALPPEETPEVPALPEEAPEAPTLPEEAPEAPVLPEEAPEAPTLPEETPEDPVLPEEEPTAADPALPEGSLSPEEDAVITETNEVITAIPRDIMPTAVGASVNTYPADGSFFGSQLSRDSRVIYDTIVQNVAALRTGATFSLPVSSLTDRSINAVRQAILDAFAAFDRDHSEIFWLRSYSGSYRKSGNTITSYEIKFPIPSTWGPYGRSIAADEATIANQVSALARGARSSSSSRQGQLRYVHDWLVNNNRYPSSYDSSDRTHWSAISAFDPSLEPVCEGYARGFKLVCDELGIPCVLVSGTSLGGSGAGAHMWTYVQMDDNRWYAVDVTWDDPISNQGDVLRHTYFLVGSSTIGSSHIPSSDDFMASGTTPFGYPALQSDAYKPPVSITSLNVTGLDAPVVGSAPDTSASVSVAAADGESFSNSNVTVRWYVGSTAFSGSAFASGTSYTARIGLAAPSGYLFRSNTTLPAGFTLSLTDNGNVAYISRTFTTTAALPRHQLRFSQSSLTVTLGGTANGLVASHTGCACGITPLITYSSSAPSVVAVNERTGALTVRAAGSATITAKIAGGSTYSETTASYQVTVRAASAWVPLFFCNIELCGVNTLAQMLQGPTGSLGFDVPMSSLYELVDAINNSQDFTFNLGDLSSVGFVNLGSKTVYLPAANGQLLVTVVKSADGQTATITPIGSAVISVNGVTVTGSATINGDSVVQLVRG